MDDLKDGIKEIFMDKEESEPEYYYFNQGSYDMGTGVIPLDGDYDIDAGISFLFPKDTYKPLEVKKWVRDSLTKGFRQPVIMRPCVRVQYTEKGEDKYHIDLAIYCGEDRDGNGQMYLAKGKENSLEENKIWEESSPFELKELIQDRFSDADDAKQFRRIIRYLKRWKDYQFKSSGQAAPRGIALTAAALKWFTLSKNTEVDTWSGKTQTFYNDINALKNVVDSMISNFVLTYHENSYHQRLTLNLPVPPSNDLFAKMTEQQMKDLKKKLEDLQSTLADAINDVDPVTASEKLQKVFGGDFPIPTKKETAEPKRVAKSSSSEGA
jgi:hypothetical protein